MGNVSLSHSSNFLKNFIYPSIRWSKYAVSWYREKVWIFGKQFSRLGKTIEDKDESLQSKQTNKQKIGTECG